MKKSFRFLAGLACAGICAFSFAACVGGAGESTLLGSPAQPVTVGASEGYAGLKAGAEAFSEKFVAAAYGAYDGTENFTVSPLSVYMALALSAQCAGGDTRAELLTALGVGYEELAEHYGTFYGSLQREPDDERTGILRLSNSVWIDGRKQTREDCIAALSEKFYCYSYMADFFNDNKNANLAVRRFVKDQTNGMIDRDFELSEYTAFALINTLYLKDNWTGDELGLTGVYPFTASDGSVRDTQLLRGEYIVGRPIAGEHYATFYAKTLNGYKLKFILPDEGYSVADVFGTALGEINSFSDYGGYDGQTDKRYLTRCFFPEFECSYAGDVIDLLKEHFGISLFFDEDRCDLSSLLSDDAYCDQIQHAAKLKVDKKGIEGAAVTMAAAADSAADPSNIEYADFIVDRAFGFVLTDRNDVTLFAGVVNHL